ncbi:MAG: hypothetical protein PHE24_02905 [Patescibacteria group bacterium]|nr:hypothetical protein [Patescibacteria group bacterium]
MFNEKKLDQEPILEKGANVSITVKFIRHGERDKESNLTDYGREVTRERARASGVAEDDFSAIKAIGSNAGPKNKEGMARSLETAHLYSHEIAGEEAFNTRKSEALNFETIISERPYHHVEIYNSFLPENFSTLPDLEKSAAAKKAQTGVVNYLLSLKGEKAETYKKEVAGTHAFVLMHYLEMMKKINSGSKILIPAGTHGGTMELLLQQALVYKDAGNEEYLGFDNSEQIGGEFDPSEAYNVHLESDTRGALKELSVDFDNPARQEIKDAHLDLAKVEELAEFYKKLHQLK